MAERLPLASAALRLRRPTGRPRTAGPVPAEPAAIAAAVVGPPLPLPEVRVLNEKQGAAYIGVSPRSLRELEARGRIARTVLLEGPKGKRRALYDRRELDRYVESRTPRKEGDVAGPR
jgi:hypothetical protein